MKTRTFTFEDKTCTLKRVTVGESAKRSALQAVIGESRKFSFAFADFQTITVEGTGFTLLSDAGDVNAVEAAYNQFLDFDEAFILKWQAEKALLNAPIIQSNEDGEKKSSRSVI